jgi:diacylglycerol O-acyltransferase
VARELLSPVDAAWFRMEDRRNPVDIVGLMTFDEPLDEARLRDTIATKLLSHARFRRRVVESPLRLMPPRWEDEPGFSIDAHLEHRTLLPEGGEHALERLVSAIASEPLDLGRSPWRLTIVDGLANGSALVSRIHHCMGDGFALMALLLSLADGAPPRAPRLEEVAPRRDRLRRAARIARSIPADAIELAHLVRLPSDRAPTWRGALSGERRIAWSSGVPLADLSAAAHARGGTVNDLVLSALTGALRRYVLDRGATPTPIRALVPVNLRPKGAPVDEEHGNRFGLVFVDLPLDAADPEARMAALGREMQRLKASPEAVVALGILHVLGRVPALVERGVSALFARKGSVVVTNVPGPRERLRFAGAELRELMFCVPHPAGLACGFSVLSYAGTVRVGVRTDVAVIPDPETIAAAFDDELARHALHLARAA